MAEIVLDQAACNGRLARVASDLEHKQNGCAGVKVGVSMTAGAGRERDFGHLLPDVAAMVGLPVQERIWFIQHDKWIGYDRAGKALEAMRDVIEQPPQNRRRGLLLAGRPNNGKSALLARLVEEYPIITRDDGEMVMPVVSISMPTKADESLLWGNILVALGVPHRDNDFPLRRKNQAISVLKRVHCRGLLIDEIHNILLGHASQQRQMLAVLKAIDTDLKLPLIVAGTVDAFRAVKTDGQVSTRFKPFGLPLWKLDWEFLRLLASLEAMIPLAEPSGLASKALAIKMHALSGGTIGGVVDTLKDAAALVLREGRERIDMDVLSRVNSTTAADYNTVAAGL